MCYIKKNACTKSETLRISGTQKLSVATKRVNITKNKRRHQEGNQYQQLKKGQYNERK